MKKIQAVYGKRSIALSPFNGGARGKTNGGKKDIRGQNQFTSKAVK